MKKTIEKPMEREKDQKDRGENSATLFESIESGRTFQDGGVIDAIANKTLYTSNQVRSMSNDRIKELLEDVADRDLDLSRGVEPEARKSQVQEQEKSRSSRRL
ncbi:hypothetical protein [Microbulbifer discodermiae]|uniref:hypothetical protein n=1 Tax=Microbulbifer sp. 2201CG32-9 TaxID=3232309 RepID=UPI00345B9E5B